MMDETLYLWIKNLHISCAFLSISGFILRGYLTLKQSDRLQQRWLKITPHINDSLLLGCAIYLATKSQQYPITHDWLTAKVIALLIYISLGMVALRLGRNQAQRATAFILAIASFFYIIAVALSRSATPWV